MKSHIDFFETFKGEMLASKRFRNRFVRRWGTEIVDDVEVLKARFTVHPGHLIDNNIQNMCKMLGSWNQVKAANFKPIAGYYFWLNPDKSDSSELERELLAEKVDEFCPKDVWQEATINYIDKADPNQFAGWTKEQILTYIDNDYRNIFNRDNGFVIEQDIDKLVMGKYVLFDDNTEFAVETVSTGIAPIQVTPVSEQLFGKGKQKYYTGLNLVIRYKRIVEGINPNGLLIDTMIEEQNKEAVYALQQLQKSTFSGNSEEGLRAIKQTTTDAIWYKDQLRYSAVLAEGIKTKVAITNILSSLDTGQIKKKVKWYKKLLGFVLIVIAVTVAIITAGSGAPASTVLTSIALYVGIAVMIMVAIQVQWAKSNAASAGYMGRWIKIGNFISMVAGLASIATSFAKNAATQSIAQSSMQAGTTAATKEVATAALQEAATQVATMSFKETLSAITIEGLKTTIKEMLVSSWKSIAFKVVSAATEMRQAETNADLQNKAQQLEESNEQLAEMMDKNLHIGVEDIQWYSDLSAKAQSRYDVNYLYEAEPSGMHIGNVCRPSFHNGKSMNLRAEDLV